RRQICAVAVTDRRVCATVGARNRRVVHGGSTARKHEEVDRGGRREHAYQRDNSGNQQLLALLDLIQFLRRIGRQLGGTVGERGPGRSCLARGEAFPVRKIAHDLTGVLVTLSGVFREHAVNDPRDGGRAVRNVHGDRRVGLSYLLL